MFKPYLKSIVRNGGKGRMGLGIELFRLDTVDESELTDEEAEEASENKVDATGTAIMRVYEEIGEDFWTGGGVTAKKFAEQLDEFGDIKRLHIHINSLGGDVFTAQAIHSIISEHKSRKTTYIDGVAASAATLIACAANEVVARMNTSYMVHYPWSFAVGNAATMRKAADDLDAVTKPILNVYKAQVGDKLDEAGIRELMEGETWMDAESALEYGFVDRIKGKIKAIASVGKSQILCSGRVMNIGKYHYRNVPKFKAEVPPTAEKPKLKQKDDMIMTREEVDPKLLGEIEANARTAERARLAALDEMNGPGLEEIITKAKAEGKQPGDIALECLKITKAKAEQASKGNALAKDAAAAGSVPAGEAPQNKPEPTEKEKAKNLIVGAFKKLKPKGVAAAA